MSALTLPNLNSSTGEKEKVAKVKKIYQNLNDAVGRAVAVYGPVEEWFASDTTAPAQATRFGQRITEFMKVSKTCTGNTSSCFPKKISLGPNNTTLFEDFYNSNYGFILADGTGVVITYQTGLAPGQPGRADGYGLTDAICDCILVDIDGPNKGGSAPGRDIFAFQLGERDDVIYPGGTESPISTYVSGDGLGLTKWVVDMGNMDYMKCASKLNWTNQTSCK